MVPVLLITLLAMTAEDSVVGLRIQVGQGRSHTLQKVPPEVLEIVLSAVVGTRLLCKDKVFSNVDDKILSLDDAGDRHRTIIGFTNALPVAKVVHTASILFGISSLVEGKHCQVSIDLRSSKAPYPSAGKLFVDVNIEDNTVNNITLKAREFLSTHGTKFPARTFTCYQRPSWRVTTRQVRQTPDELQDPEEPKEPEELEKSEELEELEGDEEPEEPKELEKPEELEELEGDEEPEEPKELEKPEESEQPEEHEGHREPKEPKEREEPNELEESKESEEPEEHEQRGMVFDIFGGDLIGDPKELEQIEESKVPEEHEGPEQPKELEEIND